MLGFIYAIRLFDLYHINQEEILNDFNLVLSGEKSINDLLKKYQISLENEQTITSFINMCKLYQNIINRKYSPNILHYVL